MARRGKRAGARRSRAPGGGDRGAVGTETKGLFERARRAPDREVARNILRRAVRPASGNASRLVELGHYFHALDLDDEAEAVLRDAVRLAPARPAAHVNLGVVLRARLNPGEAIRHFERAVALAPTAPPAVAMLAAARMERGEMAQALEAARRLFALPGAPPGLLSNALLVYLYAESLGPEECAARHGEWGRSVESGVPGNRTPSKHPDGPLVVGYVSGDFRDHAVARFLLPLLRAHDRERVRIVCYANVARPDGVTDAMRALGHRWRDISAASDAELARRCVEDRVRVLVDLSGHSAGNRMGGFARRAAPVQVSYLGYPCTTGLRSMDYRIGDPVTDPPGASPAAATEALWRLPRTLWCFDPGEMEEVPDRVDPSPPEGAPVVFGSFNLVPKISPGSVQAWARILEKVPGARLLLKSMAFVDPDVQERLRREFGGWGIGPERLVFEGWLEKREHYALYRKVDIALDPLYYNGTTTTFEALWMGVPVVTLEGGHHASRVGASILSTMGLREPLVAARREDYVDLAVRLASDPGGRAALARGLRARLRRCFVDTASELAGELEDAFEDMSMRAGAGIG